MNQGIAHADNQTGRLVDVFFEFGQISADRVNPQIAATFRQFVKQRLAEIQCDNTITHLGKR